MDATHARSQDDARTLRVAGLLPPRPRGSRREQARGLLEAMEAALGREGMAFRHVVRTWFHLDDILDWYGEFNEVRSAFFRERGVFDGVVPASTGVGIGNPAGAALVGGFLAVAPRGDRVRVRAVPSPLQCPALDYRSAFSRAVEVEWPGRRRLYVSGTASIGPGGETVRRGDPDGQVAKAMEVVEAILRSRGMTWHHVAHAVAYFVDLGDVPRLEAWRRAHRLPALDVTVVRATICRDDLLFELELEAECAAPAPRAPALARVPRLSRGGPR
jgi:enamine deaminase RidA (YjgF/YER057c/UK114 family)